MNRKDGRSLGFVRIFGAALFLATIGCAKLLVTPTYKQTSSAPFTPLFMPNYLTPSAKKSFLCTTFYTNTSDKSEVLILQSHFIWIVFSTKHWETRQRCLVWHLKILEQCQNDMGNIHLNEIDRRIPWKGKNETHLHTAFDKATLFFFPGPQLSTITSIKISLVLSVHCKPEHHILPDIISLEGEPPQDCNQTLKVRKPPKTSVQSRLLWSFHPAPIQVLSRTKLALTRAQRNKKTK